MLRNKPSVYAGNTNNNFGADMILRESSDHYGQNLRVVDTRSLVDSYYTRFEVTYNVDNNPSQVKYFRGKTQQIFAFDCTSATTLGGTYASLYNDAQQWVLWYNVDNLDSQPVIANANFIEVTLSLLDSPAVVALATDLAIKNFAGDHFQVTRNAANLEIRSMTVGSGPAADPGTTGFTFAFTDVGTDELVSDVLIDYAGIDPVWNGQTLKGYKYNIYTGKFELSPPSVGVVDSDGNELDINPDGSINVVISETGGSNLEVYYSEVLGLVSGVTQLLGTYTAVANDNLQKIDFSGDNVAEYELFIDGVLKTKKRSFFTYLDGSIEFAGRGIALSAGQIVEVFVNHTRPDPGDFNVTIHILET